MTDDRRRARPVAASPVRGPYREEVSMSAPSRSPPERAVANGSVFLYWLWTLATMAALGIVYYALTSEGLRYVVPTLGQKVYKVALPLGAMKASAFWSRLDLA